MSVALLTLVSLACQTQAPSCPVLGWDKERRAYAGRLDLLFVVDTSPGMAPHLARLREQLPRLLRGLTSGYREQPRYGNATSSSYADVHIGVASADLGLGPFAAVGGSEGGEDGVLRGAPDCGLSPGSFTWYYKGFHDEAASLRELDCRLSSAASSSELGQPLEAALKALWPLPTRTGQPLAAPAAGTAVHGDRENHGFLRDPWRANDANLIVVIVTNQDDCSGAASEAGDPLERCRQQPEQLSPIARYLEALQGPRLRGTYEYATAEVVIIAGVPTEYSGVDDPHISQYYDTLLADPRMQWRASSSGAGFEPSCTYAGAPAYPPRRLVQFAQASNYYATVIGSLCDDDLLRPIYELFERNWEDIIRVDSGETCVGSVAPHDAAGSVPCRMTWELPTTADPDKPTRILRCDERPGFLSAQHGPHGSLGPHGGALCEVRQVPTVDPTQPPLPEAGDGFYVTITAEHHGLDCSDGRVLTYTPAARPPEGVYVKLHCDLALYDPGQEPQFPELGRSCDSQLRAAECPFVEPWQSGGRREVFCHPDKHICVLGCGADSDCPPGWFCDAGLHPLSASAGRAMCIHPGCGG